MFKLWIYDSINLHEDDSKENKSFEEVVFITSSKILKLHLWTTGLRYKIGHWSIAKFRIILNLKEKVRKIAPAEGSPTY